MYCNVVYCIYVRPVLEHHSKAPVTTDGDQFEKKFCFQQWSMEDTCGYMFEKFWETTRLPKSLDSDMVDSVNFACYRFSEACL